MSNSMRLRNDYDDPVISVEDSMRCPAGQNEVVLVNRTLGHFSFMMSRQPSYAVSPEVSIFISLCLEWLSPAQLHILPDNR